MKKIFLALMLIVPALVATAQGPIKTWNDQLDDFITVFNQVDPALDQLYAGDGLSVFEFTYYEPDSGNVIKEASIFDGEAFGKVNDELMQKAKGIVISHLANASKSNSRLNSILGEFAKRGTDIVLLYSTNLKDVKQQKRIVISPSEIK